VYEAGPDMLAEHVARYVEQGVRIVGGCCGSTPEHVAAIGRALAR
jgi:methionine synthase I (cobalamin-dependent)